MINLNHFIISYDLILFIQLAFFVGSMGWMEGRDRVGIQQKYSAYFGFPGKEEKLTQVMRAEDMFAPAIIANWKVWPAIQVCPLKCHLYIGSLD